MERGTFSQSVDESQISFEKVRGNYKNNPTKIREAYYPHCGWVKINGDCTNKAIWDLAMSGALHFNLVVLDVWDDICYPDYSLKELIRN
jgi:hypothetical protein